MPRYKDQREAKKHAAAHMAAMNSFQAARSQYAMQLVMGRAPMGLNVETTAREKDSDDVNVSTKAVLATLDVAATMQLADALAREDFRLRLVETKLLGVMVGDDVVSYELPKEGESVQAPPSIVTLAKP